MEDTTVDQLCDDPADDPPLIRHHQRRDERGRYESAAPIDVQTARMTAHLHAIHCRLLERATQGRLTWRGDQIV